MLNDAHMSMLILSTSNYTNDKQLNLKGVENAVQILEETFGQHVDLYTLTNLNSTETKEKFKTYLQNSTFHQSEIFVFYFCGHGFLVGDKLDSLLLATSDTTIDNYNSEVGIKFDWIYSEIKKKFKKTSDYKFIVILDCCKSATATGNMGVSWVDSINIKQYSGSVIITSTEKSVQNSKEITINNTPYAAFTFCICSTFKRLMQRNVPFSLGELFNETKKEIQELDPLWEVPLPKLVSTNCMESNVFFNKNNRKTAKDKLKVLLVKTTVDYPIKNYDFGVPLGLWLLKSYMQLQGLSITIDIYDERLSKLISDNHKYEDIVQNYDVVGLSMCTCEVPQAIKKLHIAKSYGAITFVGGIFTSTNEKYLFDQKCIDYIIPGVSTVPLSNLLKELNKQFKKNQNSLKNCNVISHISGVATKDNLFDSFSLWTPYELPYIELPTWNEICKNYSSVLNNKIDIFTARGCVNRCEFCSIQKECGQMVIEREDESIIEEIAFLVSKGYRHFSIKDEDFFMHDSNRLLNIIKHVHGLYPNITFKIRARVDEVMNHHVNLEELYNLGIREIQYGLETPDSVLLAKIKKGYKFENHELIDFIIKTTQTGIVANCSFLLGIEGESKQYYGSLMDFFKELEPYKERIKVYINFITPHPYKNSFPLDNYKIVTNDLKYYTHKNPVAYPSSMVRVIRKAMIDTYNSIVETFDPEHIYNPSIIPELKNRFINGNDVDRVLPDYSKESSIK